jgi:hypothetical protein
MFPLQFLASLQPARVAGAVWIHLATDRDQCPTQASRSGALVAHARNLFDVAPDQRYELLANFTSLVPLGHWHGH